MEKAYFFAIYIIPRLCYNEAIKEGRDSMRIEPLGEGVEVCVSDRHHFSTDTILLADFARAKNGERVVELGTGCGTIPLLMIKNN